ncbi:Protein ACTIVITY OF BC1 COMPLEX KINASE 7 [Ranunculus cassubicifolius]
MRNTASWLRERVLHLGPTFIKLGQLSSTRSDLFPREFVDELAKLLDRLPAFSPHKARDFIESELGAPVDVMFREFFYSLCININVEVHIYRLWQHGQTSKR